MLTLKTPAEVESIIRSVERVFKTNDIEKLTKSAYAFLGYTSNGFIAHYNIHGFRAEYSTITPLARNIIDNEDANKWDNFHSGDKDYAYMMQEAKIYAELVKLARNYLGENDYIGSRPWVFANQHWSRA